MPFPSLFTATGHPRAWRVTRAAAYGALIGAAAGALKTFGPLRGAAAVNLGAALVEIAGVTLAFALLCAGASMLRNFIAERLIWTEGR
jgi:hypothetical protein